MTQITFAGRTWDVSAYDTFSDTSGSVWVDANGYLHLKCRQVGGVWKAAEVVTTERLGFGTYTFTLQGDAHNLDKNLILGMFSYLDNFHEVDVELSYWGNLANNNMAYTVQPGPPPADMQATWKMTTTGTTFHEFTWAPDHVYFASYSGTNDAGTLLSAHTTAASKDASGTRGIINLWMYQGLAPSAETEIVIRGFTFTPYVPPSSAKSTAAHVHALYYSDNFIRDAAIQALPAGDQMWTTVAGTWTLGTSWFPRQGCLYQGNQAVRAIVVSKLTAGAQADGAVSADILTTSASSEIWPVAGLVFRYASASSYYYALLGRNGGIMLYKYNGSSDTLLGSASTSGVSPMIAHNMRVSMAGGTFKVYIDGTLYLTCSDASPISSGSAGLITLAAAGQFRNFMWYDDAPADKGAAWTEFFVTGAGDNESLPLNTVKIPFGLGDRLQAGMGLGDRTHSIQGVVMSGLGPIRTQVGAPSCASFEGAVMNLERSGRPVALITPTTRTTGYLKNFQPAVLSKNYGTFSFDILEYFKNS